MILITGVAGFIGFHLAKKRLERGDEVVGVIDFDECVHAYLEVVLGNA